MAKKNESTAHKSGKSSPFLWKPFLWRFFGFFLLTVLLLPPALVLTVRYCDPPTTPLMLGRRLAAQKPSKASPSYRWVPLSNVSPHFLKAVWQTEDARFFTHQGFDWIEVNKAMAQAERTGRPPRGASTITMQCARSLFLWQGRSWVRKPLEAWFTIWMEALLTKQRILELYVNVIETGDQIYGVEAAAFHYWKVPAKKLTPKQSVLLTSILPNPRKRNPIRPSKDTQRHAARAAKLLENSPPIPK